MLSLFGPIILAFVNVAGSPCGLYEEWKTNGCNPFCSLEYQNPCPNNGPEEGCYCINGMIRDINSQCISVEKCSEQLCPQETKTLSINGCSRYCSGPGYARQTCIDAQPKCVCKEGYAEIWDNTTPTGICVLISQCRSRFSKGRRKNVNRFALKPRNFFQGGFNRK